MFLSKVLRGGLNNKHWNRRAWEIGYRGPLMATQKATGRPDYPVSQAQVAILRDRLQREYGVMKLLTRAYVTKEAEADYFAAQGVSSFDDLRQKKAVEMEHARMPGKAKRTDGSKHAVRRRANIGSLLHQHSTVEESLSELMNRRRWD